MGKTKQLKSLNLAAIFIAFFSLLILISITLKLINVFQRSTFDGQNHFTINLVGEANNVTFLSLAPSNNQIYILKVDDVKGKNLKRFLQIPLNSEIHTNREVRDSNVKNVFLAFLNPFDAKKTNLTYIDLIRLWLFVNSVPTSSIYQQEISASDDILAIRSTGVYSYFIDAKIVEEKASVEIINGTNVFGLGNKLASFLSNIGVNVVMVSTSEKEETKSRINYFGKENYTVKRLSDLLKFKTQMTTTRGLGDVTIVIGKDALKNLEF